MRKTDAITCTTKLPAGKGLTLFHRSALAFPCTYYFTQLSDSCLRKAKAVDLLFQSLSGTVAGEIAIDTSGSR